MGLELAKEGRDSSSAATLLDRASSSHQAEFEGHLIRKADIDLLTKKKKNCNGNGRPNCRQDAVVVV